MTIFGNKITNRLPSPRPRIFRYRGRYRESAEFGKGFTVSNLRNMRRFYAAFPIQDALRSELSWTHYRSLMRVADEGARNFYLEETIKSGWSSRQLDW